MLCQLFYEKKLYINTGIKRVTKMRLKNVLSKRELSHRTQMREDINALLILKLKIGNICFC